MKYHLLFTMPDSDDHPIRHPYLTQRKMQGNTDEEAAAIRKQMQDNGYAYIGKIELEDKYQITQVQEMFASVWVAENESCKTMLRGVLKSIAPYV